MLIYKYMAIHNNILICDTCQVTPSPREIKKVALLAPTTRTKAHKCPIKNSFPQINIDDYIDFIYCLDYIDCTDHIDHIDCIDDEGKHHDDCENLFFSSSYLIILIILMIIIIKMINYDYCKKPGFHNDYINDDDHQDYNACKKCTWFSSSLAAPASTSVSKLALLF